MQDLNDLEPRQGITLFSKTTATSLSVANKKSPSGTTRYTTDLSVFEIELNDFYRVSFTSIKVHFKRKTWKAINNLIPNPICKLYI